MKTSILSPLPLACVIWKDAHGQATGEYTVEEIMTKLHRPAGCMTFGLLIRHDDDGVTLANERTSDPGAAMDYTHYRGTSFIPAAMIAEVINLGVPKRPHTKKAKAEVEKLG